MTRKTVLLAATLTACSIDIDMPRLTDDGEDGSSGDNPAPGTTTSNGGTSGADGDTGGTTGSTTITWDTGALTDDTGDSEGSESSADSTGGGHSGAYGPCHDMPFACLGSETCLDRGASGGRSLCTVTGCSVAADCPSIEHLDPPYPAVPAPAEVACLDIGVGIDVCAMDCEEGRTASCPEGMTCLGLGEGEGGEALSFVCLWPPEVPGGGACPDEDLGSALGAFTGNNVGAFDDHYPSCSFGGGEDTIFSWTAPADGTYQFDTAGSGFNTSLALLEGGCGGLEFACSDDYMGLFTSQVTVDLAAGEVVAIVVDSFAGETGDFTLNIQTI